MSSQILWDCHMHSSFSADSEAPMETMIQQAIARGLDGICFTEHLDPDYPSTPDNIDFSLDIDNYRNTLFTLKDKYKEKLKIHFGIELGLQPHLESVFRHLVKTRPFDFIIGSSHIVHGYDPYYPAFFKTAENPPATWNTSNLFWKILHAFLKSMSTDILIMLYVMVQTKTVSIPMADIRTFWMKF